MATVAVDNLAAAIAQELQEYSAEVSEDMKEAVKSAAAACVTTLKQTSPKDTGDYAKGWRKKVAFESSQDIRMQVYNKTDYQLTHLLEDGFSHASGGRVAAQPHIQPAADQAAELLEKDVKIRIGKN